MSDLSQRIAGLSPEKLELLTKRLAQKNGRNSPAQEIPRRPGGGPRAPLSYAQERMWVLYQLDPSSAAFNISLAVRMEGEVDVDALARALAGVVSRHESLRTTFDTSADGLPVQIINPPPARWPLPLTDLGRLPPGERGGEMRRLIAEEAARPFDLERGPLLRTELLRLGEAEHVLLLSMHHIVSDGWSMGVLVKEAAALYDAFSRRHPPALEELPIQYADFAEWQRQWLTGERLKRQLDYWRAQLGDSPPALELPTDHARPAVASYRGGREAILLDEELTARLKELSRQEGATLFMTLLAAFQLLLHQYTGQGEIVIGSNIANRNHGTVEKLIGFFVNTLALRTNLSGDPTFRELLARARDTTLGAYAHQDVPFEMLLEALRAERPGPLAPLFQVMFVLQNAPFPAVEVNGLRLSLLDASAETSNFDLVLYVAEAGRRLAGELHYNSDLFAAATVRRMAGRFRNLLEAIAAAPGARISSLFMSAPGETAQLTDSFNAPLEEIY